MPNIKSSKKRVEIAKIRTDRNKIIKKTYKDSIKAFENAINQGLDNKDSLFTDAISNIDKACQKGVLKKNTASRKKSRLARLLNTK